MKLSKEVCQKCMKIGKWTWTDVDKALWKDGYLWCFLPFDREHGRSPRRKTEHCPYKLEHLILERQDAE